MNIDKKLLFSFLNLAISCPTALGLIQKVRRNNLTYLSYKKLINLCNHLISVKRNEIEGLFIEAGCALGGSAIIISKIKNKQRRFNIYDTFEQIPPPSSKDEEDAIDRYQIIDSGKARGINSDEYYGYQENLLDKVKKSFLKFNIVPEENNIEFIQGLFNDVLLVSEAIAFAHIDSDWYDSISISLERIVPNLRIGGLIIIDDYNDWHGAKKATDDYFVDKLDKFKFISGPQLVIKKISD